ncbi:hypothetical protein BS78_K203500 [Paspalum vaginatum]|uniref:Uncharacterized protein n=1 Tax=Paspalum vaginatum TaxID=158149 RepID=A0A9W8CES9_9POAL|nr:hypothetical protein BS78_K203500 [Paspalum vaginatum]
MHQALREECPTRRAEDGISFIVGNIYALVKVGFYTTVWWKFTPCGIDMPPEELLPISCDLFFNDKAIVPFYTKITLLETPDISDIVMSMPRMQDPAEANIDRKWRVGVSLGIMIGFCFAIGILKE